LSDASVPRDRVAAYGEFYRTLTSENLDNLERLCAPDMRFSDPFNDVRGVADTRRVFYHMFATLDAPVFVIEDTAISGQTAYFKWTFTARTKGRGSMAIHLVGMTEARFDAAGLVTAHIDHWDAASQIHARLPIIGGLFRWFARRFTV
jgi:steroid Delta-isomerase